jgi:hypothetical protein
MKTIRVMIKGGRWDALNALAARGLSSVGTVEERPVFGIPHTFTQVAAESEPRVVRWFLEGRRAPFPAGSLMLYSFNELGEGV